MANKIAVLAILILIILIIVAIVYLIRYYIPSLLSKSVGEAQELAKRIDTQQTEIASLHKSIEEITRRTEETLKEAGEIAVVCKSSIDGLAIKMNESKKEVDETLRSVLDALKKVNKPSSPQAEVD